MSKQNAFNSTQSHIEFQAAELHLHNYGPRYDNRYPPEGSSADVLMLRTREILKFAIDDLNLDQFLPMLTVLDQDKHISAIPPLDRDDPVFYWVFKNEDFVKWNSADEPQVLWLSGPPKCNIHQASSCILSQEKSERSKTGHFVLHLFCSAGIRKSSFAIFVHTFLSQLVRFSPIETALPIIRRFLHGLLHEVFIEKAAPNWKMRGFNEGDSPDKNLRKLLDASADENLAAFMTILNEEQRDLSVIIDGLDTVGYQRSVFIKGVRVFVNHLLQQRPSKVKILLTSQPLAEIKDLLDGLPCIEYDKERKECLATLRFDNTRYDKISRENRGSFEWTWRHNQYRDWSMSGASRLLYIEGKPGSGKSTLTKYFADHLLEQEPAAKSAIVAKFFYSYREGELQRSHYNMIRSILYDILDQDPAFYYHRFQTEYRDQCRREPRVAWSYDSLKTVLKSLQDYPLERRVYLIIDAVDESEENDRRDVLKLLFDICSKTKHSTAKVFVASRPVGELDVRISPSHHNIIRLQDETKQDISRFSRSFLNGLNLTRVLAQATKYIVENAQGVFLWAKLVGEELETYAAKGYSEEQIFESLQSLPTELEIFYQRMFEKMDWEERYPTDAVKIFRFVPFGRRPLTIGELLHALAIPGDPDTQFTPTFDLFQRRIPSEQRIIRCGGNFLEIKSSHGNMTIQVMHQTVREFFLDPHGHVTNSKTWMCAKDAHACISITCIRYLILCAANTAVVKTLPQIRFWTSEHYERYAQYLDKWPLANYVLCYLKHHINGCHGDANVLGITLRLLDELTHHPTVYLLEKWVSSCLEKIILAKEQGAAAMEFRNKILHAAVRNGFSTVAEALLTVGANVNAELGGRTPLQEAAGGGHVEIVDKLLAANADVNAVPAGYGGRTALQAAANSGHIEIVDKLLAANADVNAAPAKYDGRTALQAAAGGGHVEIVEKLLAANADVNAAPAKYDGRTALQAAADSGYVEIVDKLIAAYAIINAAPAKYNGRTALQAAASGGHVEIVDKLLAVNALVNAAPAEYDGRTALQAAADSGHIEIVDKLLAANALVNTSPAELGGRTALQAAAGSGHIEIVDKLLAAYADVNAAPAKYDGRTAFQAAASSGHVEIVDKLLAANADVNAAPVVYDGRTALQAAASGGHVEIVDKLLAVNALVNAAPAKYNGRTALQAASSGGHVEIVDKLLAANALVNAAPAMYYGRTALQAAADSGHVEIVDKLLAANADINAVPAKYNGRTALQAAADSGHVEIVDKLLAVNALVNAVPTEYNGRTALQAAANSGHIEIVDKLLAAYADVNAAPVEYDGRTALQAAASGGHVEIVEKLLAANALVNAAPAKYGGRTALQAAADSGHVEIVDRLKRAGAAL